MTSITNRRRFFQTSGIAAAGIVATQTHAAEPINRPYGKHFKLSLAGYSYRKYLAGDSRNNIAPTMTMMEFLDACAEMGLGASEPTSYYFPADADEEYYIKFKRHAYLLGLDISGTAIGNNFTHDAGSERDNELEKCKKWIDNAAIFGAPCIRIFAGSKKRDMSFDQAVKNCIETTQLACDYAAKKGVYLALENHGGIVAEPEPLIKIVEEVESDWIGINLDGGNFHTDDPYKSIAMCAPYAVNVQLKVSMSSSDGKRFPADFGRILDILDKASYRGYIALEYEERDEPKEVVPPLIEKLQKMIA